ncbi:hypothetical protein F2Q70_00016297 [Brassica cretica]|uniref:Uncharacterized protein n=1 Tax=Brassica cretica TaxID=69181 RepID=A0A8S9HS63_BRACR|nr:hypothetical protein F2Q70_00016297 [Brassica cretica]
MSEPPVMYSVLTLIIVYWLRDRFSPRLEMIIELSQDYRMNPQQVVSEPQFRRFKDSSETDQDRF